MFIETYIPQKLNQYIKLFWCICIPDGARTLFEENIIPDGHHEIIFHFNKAASRKNINTTNWIEEPKAFIAGQTSKSYSLKIFPGSILYGVRFYPHSIASLIKPSSSLFTDNLGDLDTLGKIKELKQCIDVCEKKTFRQLELYLQKMIIGNSKLTNGYKLVNAASDKIIQHKGNINIDAVLKHTDISGKYLDSLFEQYIGITPKKFANTIKLNSFIKYRNEHSAENLTQCSYEAGFYDQSHLIKLFKEITGDTPGIYFRKQNLINNSFASL